MHCMPPESFISEHLNPGNSNKEWGQVYRVGMLLYRVQEQRVRTPEEVENICGHRHKFLSRPAPRYPRIISIFWLFTQIQRKAGVQARHRTTARIRGAQTPPYQGPEVSFEHPLCHGTTLLSPLNRKSMYWTESKQIAPAQTSAKSHEGCNKCWSSHRFRFHQQHERLNARNHRPFWQ